MVDGGPALNSTPMKSIAGRTIGDSPAGKLESSKVEGRPTGCSTLLYMLWLKDPGSPVAGIVGLKEFATKLNC
jgi:hypothetical protein